MEKITPKVRPTICRDCIFAKYNKKHSQVGCRFHNRLWNLEENGAKLTLVEENNKEYYRIEDRFCSAVRNFDWAEGIPKENWKARVEDFIKIRLTYIIAVKENNKLEDVLKTISQAEIQSPAPYSILVVMDPHYTPTEIFDTDAVRDYLVDRPISRWSIERIPIEKAIKFNKTLGVHYTIFFGGSDIPVDFSTKLNKALNYDMKRFIALKPDETGNGGVFQTGINLEEIIENENVDQFIKRLEDII